LNEPDQPNSIYCRHVYNDDYINDRGTPGIFGWAPHSTIGAPAGQRPTSTARPRRGHPGDLGDGRPCDAGDGPISQAAKLLRAMVSLEWLSLRLHIDCYEFGRTNGGRYSPSSAEGGGRGAPVVEIGCLVAIPDPRTSPSLVCLSSLVRPHRQVASRRVAAGEQSASALRRA
jgi:hypothetical protein